MGGRGTTALRTAACAAALAVLVGAATEYADVVAGRPARRPAARARIGVVTGVLDVETRQVPIGRLTPVIGDERAAALAEMAAAAREELAGATVWTVSAGESGGGVSEMIRALVGYTLDVGVDVRWCTIAADPAYFATTRRLHRALHGFDPRGDLGAAAAAHYAAVGDALGEELAARVQPGDVVLLHDAETAGLSPQLARAGAHVIWRCHVGADRQGAETAAAWHLLEPHLEPCQAFIFSRGSYAPEWLPSRAVTVIPPSIDPFSPKNEDLSEIECGAVLRDAGILARGTVRRRFSRPGGTPAAITRPAALVGEQVTASRPLVVQVSRWDGLKDMAGVLAAFAGATLPRTDAHLVLAGPDPRGAGRDPDADAVLAECVAARERLPAAARRRVTIVTLPVDDVDENALVVNALQRQAAVVVQKSLAEGYSLTVAEGMWKARPVVASAVGGVVDQIVPGTGVLLEDPADHEACGRAVADLLEDDETAYTLGERARRRVLDEFVGDQHLAAYARLMGELHLRPR